MKLVIVMVMVLAMLVTVMVIDDSDRNGVGNCNGDDGISDGDLD